VIFDPSTGALQISTYLVLSRDLIAAELVKTLFEWEEWRTVDGQVVSWRTVFIHPESIPNKQVILVVDFEPTTGKAKGWSIGPRNLIGDYDVKTNGNPKRIMRRWFNHVCNASIPEKGTWGRIDVVSTPREFTTMVECIYSHVYA
jgi:hypothetical protein